MSTELILGIIFFILSCLMVILRKTYFQLPLTELTKRQDLGETVPAEFTQVLAYGSALRGLLWLYLGLFMTLSLTFLARALPIWGAIIVIILALFYVFSYLPSTKVSRQDQKLTTLLAPALSWLLKYKAKYINRLYLPLAKHYTLTQQNIFDEADLLDFFKQLARTDTTRIDPEVLMTQMRFLSFNRSRVSDLMIPAKKVKAMLEDDVIGPLLINDLHESAEGYAVVREEPKGDITGMLALADLNIKSQGKVASHMRREVFFVAQNDQLQNVIKAFFDTKSPIFVVVSDNQKFVGIISLEAVIKKLTGSLSSLAVPLPPPVEPAS